MITTPRILQVADLEQLLALERKHVRGTQADEFEAEMVEWHAPWRKEALEHYLPLGWSFGLFQGQEILGYFLAQPQLFLNGMTQSLWLEHLFAPSPQIAKELIDVAYRLAREKHFQSLLYKGHQFSEHLPRGANVEAWPDSVYNVKTAKY